MPMRLAANHKIISGGIDEAIAEFERDADRGPDNGPVDS